MIPELDLLARLRDVHPPPAPQWWPPAPGWWVALLLVVALTVITIRYAPAWWRRWRMRRRLMAALDATATVAEVSQLLRLAALARFPEHRPAGLQGADWVAFLETCDRIPGRFAALREALTEMPYRAPGAGEEAARLRAAARGWLRAVL